MTEATIIQAVTLPRVQALLQEQGYRVTVSEQNGLSQLLSASQGIGFSLRFGNPAQTQGEFVDYTFSCALRVQGDLPAGLADSWNAGKRFARLSVQGNFLVLEMDVILAGGVTENHLRANTELWDRLLQELVLFLRQFMQQAEGAGATAAPLANGEAVNA
ncbi:YbjN domain-containing protein [Bordetella genomosp. 5]|uniref:YbjN domain-containing protein n=1 Tax=Bordetella genomosp. 5 TaxID=1395608 RepID=A0A261T3M1_9BORD|nr:YbjN domain-containing protein [Bordetella genomosp. 5]OZI43847.1 hypothetical protein CAL25_23260 [Bordetella genomosp. 5]